MSTPVNNNKGDIFHVIHKVPSGDSPYVRAKHIQVKSLRFIHFFLICFFWVVLKFLVHVYLLILAAIRSLNVIKKNMGLGGTFLFLIPAHMH